MSILVIFVIFIALNNVFFNFKENKKEYFKNLVSHSKNQVKIYFRSKVMAPKVGAMAFKTPRSAQGLNPLG